MAKDEKIAVNEPDFSKVVLKDVSAQDLMSYKKMADMMFEHYDNWAKSFIGDYDPSMKANYDILWERANYFKEIREAIRGEMENRLLNLDEAVRIWEDRYGKKDE